MLRFLLGFSLLGSLGANLAGADWQPIAGDWIKSQKPGFGGLCGVVVDPATGDLIVNLSDKGLFRSADQGKTWQPVATFKGRTEWPGCLMLDPVGPGQKLVAALVYGAPILVSDDQGKTVRFLDKKSAHVDWFALDWSDPEHKFILTLKHESGDLLLVSRDGGKSFEEVGKGFGTAWIFDRQTAVVAEAKSKTRPQPRILRTTDAGRTFTPVAEYAVKALPRWHKDRLYWLVDGALLQTTDQGQTWTKLSDVKDGRYGPIFGKTAQHLFVLTTAGVLESDDAGKHWKPALAVPKDFKGVSSLTWIDYDPAHDTLYLMKMGSDLYRWKRE